MALRQGSIASLLSLAALGCVPATAETDPHGGVEVRVHPSPTARGEPFTTSDGWTVTVERLAVQAGFGATSATQEPVRTGFTFSAAEDQSLVIVAVPAGVAVVTPVLTGRLIGGPKPVAPPPDDASHGIDPALDARFESLADSAPPTTPLTITWDAGAPTIPQGPAFILAAHGSKGAKTVRFDLSVADFESPSGATLRVAADALTPVDFTAEPQALFTREDDDAVVFDDVAAADTDGDGDVSPAELRKTFDIHCSGCSPLERAEGAAAARESGLTVPTLFGNRLSKLLRPR